MKRALHNVLLAIATAATAALSLNAGAISIGEPQILSSLGEPLRVRVPILDYSGSGTVRMSLLPASSYDTLALIPPPGDRNISGRVVQDGGQTYFWVESTRVITEPVFDLAIEASMRDFVSVRHVTVMLDPPEVVAATAPATDAPATALPAQPTLARPAAPQPTTTAPVESRAPTHLPAQAVTTTAVSAEQNTYGPVRRGETLSQIAEQARPAGTSLWPYVAALAAANPGAVDADGTNLIVGSELVLPDAAAVSAQSAAAIARVLAAVQPSDTRRGSAPAARPQTAALPGVVFDSRAPRLAAAADTTARPALPVEAAVLTRRAAAPPRFTVSESFSDRSFLILAENPLPAPAPPVEQPPADAVVEANQLSSPVQTTGTAPAAQAVPAQRAGYPWWLLALGLALVALAIYGLLRLVRDALAWRQQRAAVALEDDDSTANVVETSENQPLKTAPEAPSTDLVESEADAASEQDYPLAATDEPAPAEPEVDPRRALLRDIEGTLLRTVDQSLRSKLTLAEAMAENGRLDRARGLLNEVVAALPAPTATEQTAAERWGQKRAGARS